MSGLLEDKASQVIYMAKGQNGFSSYEECLQVGFHILHFFKIYIVYGFPVDVVCNYIVASVSNITNLINYSGLFLKSIIHK